MLENHGYSGVVGNSAMPYFNFLWSGGATGTAPVTDYTQMYAVAHPSLPNYLAIASGSTQGTTGSDLVTPGEFNAPSLWDQLTNAGISWGVYEEGMPATCSPAVTYNDTSQGGTDGQYVLRHNPGSVFSPVYSSPECQNVQPLSALSTAALPDVSFVTPNICDDDHGLSSTVLSTLPYQNCLAGSSALLQRGDSWLASHVPAWTSAGADVLITWDEGSGTAGVGGTSGGGQVAALLTGPGVTPGQDANQYSHYSVLAGIEQLYGLPPLQGAATANPLPFPGPGTAPQTGPQVTISSPGPASTLAGTVEVSGTATATAGATISQVQVSVDGQNAESATTTTDPLTGATDWTASFDTTTLTNGFHTFSAEALDSNGDVGTASVTVSVGNTAGTSCPALPAGAAELSGNLSLETSQTGWTGQYNSKSVLTRSEPPSGSYDGLFALRIGLKSGTSGAAGVNNAGPSWVPGSPGVATAAGSLYTASAFVAGSTAGEQVTLLVREATPSGSSVSSKSVAVTLSDTLWHQLTVSYTAKYSGDALRYSLFATNLASSAQSLLADCLSLQTP